MLDVRISPTSRSAVPTVSGPAAPATRGVVALLRPDVAPRGAMLRPVGCGSAVADCGVLSLQIGRSLHVRPDVIEPIPGLRIGSPEFEALLDAETQSQLRLGNRVKPLLDGKSAFEARDRLFAAARPGEAIHQQTFVSSDDRVGWHNARQMRRHALIGPARHLYDGLGSLRAVFNNRRIFKFMSNGGVEVHELSTRITELLTRPNRLRHQKFLLLGTRMAIVGGTNIGDMYANNGVPGNGKEGEPGNLKIVGWERPYKLIDWRGWFFRSKTVTFKQPWHDIDFQIEGPVVADFQRAFIHNWTEQGHALEPTVKADLTNVANTPFFDDGCGVRFVDHRPFEMQDDHITVAMVRHIDAAQSSIVIETPYFSPPPPIRAAMLRARERGVTVTVLTNSRTSTNHKLAYDAGHGLYPELLAAGITIYERTSMLHAKVMVIDDAVTLGGSANLNGRTRYCDTETLVIMNNPEVALATRATVEAQFDRASLVTPEPHRTFLTAVRDATGALFRKTA